MRFNPFDEEELNFGSGSVGVLPAPEMDPNVKKYLMDKMQASPQAPAPEAIMQMPAPMPAGPSYLDELKEAQARSEDRQSGLGGFQFLAGIGDAIAGRSASTSAATFDKMRSNINEEEIGGLKQRREASDLMKNDDKLKREQDPASAESLLAQSLGKKMLPSQDFSKMNAQQINSMLPGMSKIYDIEQRKLDRQEARDERRFQSGIRTNEKADIRDEKRSEKMQSLSTPYGLANNEDDAKKLKEAHESKKSFDSKLSEMIALREKHNGGALWNRDDVGRGKQLSKDLLLEYKNIAKLGVLSVSDENILNEIIPPDPLEYNSPVAGIQGQDPVLHKMKAFKTSTDEDFATRVSTRTRGGGNAPQKAAPKVQQSTEVERFDKATGKTAIFDSATKQFLRFK